MLVLAVVAEQALTIVRKRNREGRLPSMRHVYIGMEVDQMRTCPCVEHFRVVMTGELSTEVNKGMFITCNTFLNTRQLRREFRITEVKK